jgi:double-stranded uracil-DNA glycosylase
LPYDERRRIVSARGMAVWDVLAECRRKGSLDSAIEAASERVNDFAQFFRAHRSVEVVFFNGHKAEAAFRRHVLAAIGERGRELRFVRLPSTSPAHAGRTFGEKLSQWRAVVRALEERERKAIRAKMG